MRVRTRSSRELSPHPHLLRFLLGFALGLTCFLAVGWALHRPIRATLAHWTGEEALWEQLKGTGALAVLRLTQPAPRTDPYIPMAHTGLNPYGINTFLEQEAEPAKVERSLDLIAAAGFHWIRQEFPWEDLEIASKGDFWDHKWDRSTWQKYDRIVAGAEERGLEVIARLDNPPAWTRAVGEAPGWTMAPPDNLPDYGDFVYAVVSRYRGHIRYYQLWNEPNIYPEWGDQPANPEAYVALLKVGYTRAKEADPDCVIIAAGLAQTTENTPAEFGPRNMSDLVYLERMYAAGARDYFDIMGAMVYGLWTGPYDRRASVDRTNFSRAQLIREIMVRHGDGAKPLWATEVGWNALPADFALPPNFGRVSPEQQARYAVEAYQRAAHEWPWMGVMNYWFLRRPSEAERDQTWYYFRMLEPDFTPLPVYDALSAWMRRAPAVPIGFYQEDHWALAYEGPWQVGRNERAVLGGWREGTVGAMLRFGFEGTRLDLVLGDPAQADDLQVLVDGRSRTLKPLGLAPYTQAPAVRVVRGLHDGRHSVELTVARGAVALDGLIVRRERPWWPWAALAGTLLATGGGLAWRRYARRAA